MKLNEYQVKAHSTACHGNTLAYPIAALAEEAGEVLLEWGGWVKQSEYLIVKYDEVKAKLLDEIGDVCWNLAELVTLMGVDLEYLDNFANKNHVSNSTPISYYMCGLSSAVGKINGTWAKYIRKHDGQQPTLEEVTKEDLNEGNFRSTMIGHCIVVLHIIHDLVIRLDLDLDEILEHNINKLAERKKNNTLGGLGSVDTRSNGL